MIQFTNRQHDIICMLMNSKYSVTGKEIADKLGISVRTVQSDIAHMNRISPIILSSNRGYVISQDAANHLARQVDAPAIEEDYTFLPHRILQIFSQSNRSWRIDDLAEALFISTPTLERHLRQIPSILAPHQLELRRHGGMLWIEGEERDKRQLIGSLIAQEAGASFHASAQAANLFADMDIGLVRSLVESIIDAAGYRIKQGYEDNLYASITIALYRMRVHAHVETCASATPATESAEHRIADELCQRYSLHFRIDVQDGDLAYLATLFHGQIEPVHSEERHAYGELSSSALAADVKSLVNEVLDSFLLHIDFSQPLYSFAMHVDALLRRDRTSQMQDDGMLDNIKRRFPFVYEVALLVAHKISERYNVELSDGEIGFICIHIGLLLEHTATSDHMRIGLNCRDYHGTAKRIRTGILEQCPDAIIVDNDEIADGNDLDLLVTTRRVREPYITSVEISPLFTNDDRIELVSALALCEQRRRDAAMRDLFSTYLDDQLFFVDESIGEKQAAISFLGNRMHAAGIVNEEFTASVFKREALSPTCFFNLFAIPHALEMNAARTMVAILINPQGIRWDEQHVRIVLMIAIRPDDRKEFMKLYDGIVKALWDGGTAEQAAQAKSIGQFLRCISHA